MPPDDQMAHLKASCGIVEMKGMPYRESSGAAQKESNGVFVQIRSGDRVFMSLRMEVQDKILKPVYRPHWDAPGWGGAGWFFPKQEQRDVPKVAILTVHRNR